MTDPLKSAINIPEEELDENFFKRERRRKEEIKKTIDRMRGDLPVYDLEEIRQYRLPYHEALLINLRERGFESSASFIRELFAFQEDLRKQAGPSSHVWLRPLLMSSRAELDQLQRGLSKSEAYHQQRDHVHECDEFLVLAIYFSFGPYDHWWWLGEQLLFLSIRVSSGYAELQGKYEALSRFAYARFLIETLKEFDDAKEHLQLAREMSRGKGWTSKQYFPEERGTLFMQVSRYLYECVYRNMEHLMKTDYEKAIPLAIEARRRAADACFHDGETRALIMKGICEMNTKTVKAAINSFVRAFQLQLRFGTREGMCKVRIHLAKAYLMDGNTAMSLKTLMQLKVTAEQYNLPFYLGQAYKNLGEYYLTNGEPAKANPLLNESLKILQQCNLASRDIEMVRNLEAISGGLELFPKYVDLLYKAGTNDGDGFRHLMKTIDWKDERTPFWDKGKTGVLNSLCSILNESMDTLEDDGVDKGQEVDPVVTPVGEPIEGKKTVANDGKEVIELHDNKESFNMESETVLN